MNKNQKKGITLASLVIYVVVFSVITSIVSIIYTNMNDTLFFNRGRSINYTEFNKLEYNLEHSAAFSNDIIVTSDSIEFSNDDNYTYFKDEKTLMLNGGILCTNVIKFEPVLEDKSEVKLLKLKISFDKYSSKLEKEILLSVEVN